METIKGYKAFNKDMTCKGFKYEVGKEYEISDPIEICKSGFHFCENPFEVLRYYDLCESEFGEVETLPDSKIERNSEDSKISTSKIKIKAKISLKGYICACVNFLLEITKTNHGNYSQLAASGNSSKLAASGDYSKLAASGNSSKLAASGDYSKLAASGNYSQLAASGNSSKLAASGNSSQLAASGDYSKLAASGNYSQLAASGNSSKLAASGDYSKLAASGNYSQLAASGNSSQLAASGNSSKLAASGNYSKLVLDGKNSIGAAIGKNSSIKGMVGCWITLAEWSNDKPVCVKSVKIDGKKIKADTFYKLENGKFVITE